MQPIQRHNAIFQLLNMVMNMLIFLNKEVLLSPSACDEISAIHGDHVKIQSDLLSCGTCTVTFAFILYFCTAWFLSNSVLHFNTLGILGHAPKHLILHFP